MATEFPPIGPKVLPTGLHNLWIFYFLASLSLSCSPSLSPGREANIIAARSHWKEPKRPRTALAIHAHKKSLINMRFHGNEKLSTRDAYNSSPKSNWNYYFVIYLTSEHCIQSRASIAWINLIYLPSRRPLILGCCVNVGCRFRVLLIRLAHSGILASVNIAIIRLAAFI